MEVDRAVSGFGEGGAVVFRADADFKIGTGHVMRCLALAQACQESGRRAHFVFKDMPEECANRLHADGITLERTQGDPGPAGDIETIAQTAASLSAPWVVVDGYSFGAEYQQLLKEAGLRVLFIDDYGHGKQYCADLVLNQNIGASPLLYRERGPETRLLLGARYALLRREFRRWQTWQRTIPDRATRILVTMGGSDPAGLTLRVLRALEMLDGPELDVVVVVGAASTDHEAVVGAAPKLPFKCRVIYATREISSLMAWADTAVSAAGSTWLELAAMGLPSMVIAVAENQRAILGELSSRRLFVAVDGATASVRVMAEELDRLVHQRALREQLSSNCRQAVDAEGAPRVCREMSN